MDIFDICRDDSEFDNETIIALLKTQTANINNRNANGDTPLINIIISAHTKKELFALMLIHMGCDINFQNVNTYSALMNAIQSLVFNKKKNKIHKMLIITGANIEQNYYTDPVLTFTRADADYRIKPKFGVFVLLSCGACVNYIHDNLYEHDEIYIIALCEAGVDIKYLDFMHLCNFSEKFQKYFIKHEYFEMLDTNPGANDFMIGEIVKYYKAKIEKIQYQIHPGTEFWKLIQEEYPNISTFNLLK